GLTFRIHGPENAHSKTDVMIQVVEDGVMFLGDNVTYGRLARMDDGTFLGNIDACQVAIDSGAKIFVPGHGPTAGVEVPTSFKTYLETVYQSVEVLLDEDLQAFEMKPLILEKVRDYESWVDFDINFGKHISLAVLEVERNF
ncbi:MAG: MBL fold metallo-hydrolase, partial [Gammaproteobacteria bacterium]